MYARALQIAHKAHKGQTRDDGKTPYIVHPIRVSQQFDTEEEKIIAVLHDVVEDTDVTLAELKKHFPWMVTEEIDALTRREGETHFDYIRRIKNNDIATVIKIADIIDNLSDTTPPSSMIDRYMKSLDILIK